MRSLHSKRVLTAVRLSHLACHKPAQLLRNIACCPLSCTWSEGISLSAAAQPPDYHPSIHPPALPIPCPATLRYNQSDGCPGITVCAAWPIALVVRSARLLAVVSQASVAICFAFAGMVVRLAVLPSTRAGDILLLACHRTAPEHV